MPDIWFDFYRGEGIDMNKDLLGMDSFEDDDDDPFSGGSLSDLFSMFSGKDSDMSEEEKEALISKNKTAITAAVKDFVDSNADIRRLLVINTLGQSIDSAAEEDLKYADSLSYDDLVDAGYIIHEIGSDTLDKNKEKVHCRLSVDASDDSIDFTVFCDYDFWLLDEYRARPLEIQKIIYDHFKGMEGILSKKLSYMSCSNQAIRNDVGAVMAIYNERRSLFGLEDDDDEEDKDFPLKHYSEITKVVTDRLLNNTEISKYIGREDASGLSADELISAGYVRPYQKITADSANTPDQYLIMYLEDSLGVQFSFDIVSKNAAGALPDGTDKSRMILKCIKDAMRMIPGAEAKGSPSRFDLNDEWSVQSVNYGIEVSEETLTTVIPESDRKRVKPRFFVDIDTLNQILDLELTDEEFESDEIQELHIDITDIPNYMRLTKTDDGKELTIYERSEFHVSYDHDGIEKGKLTLSKENGAKGTASDGSIGENLGAFFKASMLISKHFLASGLGNEIDLVDFDQEGFRVSVYDDGIHFKMVSGRARPSMMCSSLFNPTRMMRPYMDEMAGATVKELGGGEAQLLTMAEAGDESAMTSLAEIYANGDDQTDISPEKAFYWYEKAAELDNPLAQYNLGQLYLRGFGTERDFEKAIYWMKKAAENGDEDAPGQVSEYEKMYEASKNAENGDPAAQAEYASFLMKMGKTDSQVNGDKDFVESVKWAEKAAAQGNADALWTLALAYEQGRGVEEDRNKAIELYAKGAELNHPDSMNSLAAFISRREVPGKTKQDAFELIKKAAEMGNVLAMRNLGHSYQFEEGTGFDMKQAIYWYEKYLEHEEDEELAQKVMIFKMMPDFPDMESSEEDDDYEKVDPAVFANNLTGIEFKDKIFVLTGFDTREENRITQIITERGGIIKSLTVLKTDYLVVMGDYSSRKYARAVELNKQGKNIAIITIEQFYKLMK